MEKDPRESTERDGEVTIRKDAESLNRGSDEIETKKRQMRTDKSWPERDETVFGGGLRPYKKTNVIRQKTYYV